MARYHPLYDGLWNDDAFEPQGELPAASFEERAFFAFLCSNSRCRPSGIYRASDEQFAIDSYLPAGRVRRHLVSLSHRHRIVRDVSWVFVRGYLSRQPKGERLLLGVKDDLQTCSSGAVLASFIDKYASNQQLVKWASDRLETIKRPCNGLAPQSSTEQYRAEQSSTRSVDRVSLLPDPMLEPTDPDERRQWLTTPHGVLAWLNKKAGRSFRPEPTHLSLIEARIASGITPAQLRIIVSNKVEEWNHEPRPGERDMRKYLRPATLFGREKCEQYVGELGRSEEPE